MTSTDVKRVEITIGEIASSDVQQSPPECDFTYIDISSVDRETKAVVEPKRLSAMEAPSRARQLLRGGDVLISMTRPNLNAIALVPDSLDGAVGSTGFYVLRSEHVATKYLYYLVQTEAFVSAMSAKVQGALYPAIRPKDIHEFAFHLETPERQTRIVAKLEELLSDLDAGVAELKAAQAKLTQYRQSLLKAAVEGALTADWRARRAALETTRPAQPADAENRPRPTEFRASFAAGQRRRHETPPTGGCAEQEDCANGLETGAQLLARILTERRARWEARQLARFQSQGKTPPKGWQSKYPEPVAPDTRDLPELPEGWVWATIGQCFQVAVGATPSRKIATYWKGEIPWVSSGEVQFCRITSTKESITKDGLHNSSTQVNPAGSVLLGMIGEGKTRGQVAILDTPAANNQNCAAIWVSETDVPPEYVYFWLWSRYNQTRKGSSGNNQPALNKSIVERIPIPLPPFWEIREIVALVETQFLGIDKEADAIAHLLAQSAAQRQNLLKAAFSGQLVPQDPNDEPASVLVERIRALQPARAYRSRKKVTA